MIYIGQYVIITDILMYHSLILLDLHYSHRTDFLLFWLALNLIKELLASLWYSILLIEHWVCVYLLNEHCWWIWQYLLIYEGWWRDCYQHLALFSIPFYCHFHPYEELTDENKHLQYIHKLAYPLVYLDQQQHHSPFLVWIKPKKGQ